MSAKAKRERKPALFFCNCSSLYALFAHEEHIPRPSSDPRTLPVTDLCPVPKSVSILIRALGCFVI